MTRTTGWLGNDEPEAPRPPMPLTERLLANREHRAGALETALARSAAADARQAREAAGQALDPDDYAANLIGRGYLPGMVSRLSMQLADTVAELEDEEAKIEKAAKRNEHLRRAHEGGRIGGFDIVRALAEGEDGDEGRVRVLQRRAEQLRHEIAEANEAITPPERRDPDPLEAAASRAHAAFVEATRARMAEVQARPPRRPASRPFAGHGAAVRSEVTCQDCRNVGATPEQSFLIHQDPDAPFERQLTDLDDAAMAALGPAPGWQAERRDGRVPMIYR